MESIDLLKEIKRLSTLRHVQSTQKRCLDSQDSKIVVIVSYSCL